MATTNESTPSQLLQYLPAIYQEDAFLGHFLLAFEKVLLGRGDDGIAFPDVAGPSAPAWPLPGLPAQGLEEAIADLARLFDPARTPDAFLPWLAGWAALSLRADLGPRQKRDFIANMVQLHQSRGTKENLRRLLDIFTSVDPTITETAQEPEFRLGPESEPGVHATIGRDTYLSGGRPHFFRVVVDFRTSVRVNEQLPLTIELRDADENPVQARDDTPVTLALNPNSGTLSTLESEENVSFVTIPEGQTSTVLLYKPEEVRNVHLMATAPGLWEISQAITVTAIPDASATQLAIKGTTVTHLGAKLVLTIELRDANGNPAKARSDTTARLVLKPAIGTFSTLGDDPTSIDTVSIPSGATSVVVIYHPATPENLVLTAAAENLQEATRALTVFDKSGDTAPTQLAIPDAAAAGALLALRKIAIIRALIELEKPAHTDYELDVIYPTMQIGVHSTVGVDTLLGTVTET